MKVLEALYSLDDRDAGPIIEQYVDREFDGLENLETFEHVLALSILARWGVGGDIKDRLERVPRERRNDPKAEETWMMILLAIAFLHGKDPRDPEDSDPNIN